MQLGLSDFTEERLAMVMLQVDEAYSSMLLFLCDPCDTITPATLYSILLIILVDFHSVKILTKWLLAFFSGAQCQNINNNYFMQFLDFYEHWKNTLDFVYK